MWCRVAEHLFSMPNTLSVIPSTMKRIKREKRKIGKENGEERKREGGGGKRARRKRRGRRKKGGVGTCGRRENRKKEEA